MGEKKWITKQPNLQKIQRLSGQLGGTREFLCKIFVDRGLDTEEKVKLFFKPDRTGIGDPFLLKDMEKACSRILESIEKQEKILIYGDYDVDGTTGVSLLYQFLSSIYSPQKILYYLPDRLTEGYGLSLKGVEYAAQQGVHLLISIDCGITAVEESKVLHQKGIDFIIVDHHLPGNELPKATAILNPKQPACPYPYKELSGCGVAYKLIAALGKKLAIAEEIITKYLDLVVVSIGADVVPLTGENRVLSYLGLEVLNSCPSVGMKALIDTAGGNGTVDMYAVSFLIAPRINAAGRMQHAEIVVRLLLETIPEKAAQLAQQLNQLNEERKKLDDSITHQAIEILKSETQFGSKKATIVYNEAWHKGVVGIVASRLIENYYKPTIVLTKDGDLLTGSARSVSGFNLYDTLHACSVHLVKFGGHTAAAGLSLLPENLPSFKKQFESLVEETIAEESLVPKIHIAAEIPLEEIDAKLYRTLERMEPYGLGNPKPVFLTRNLWIGEWTKIVGEKHVRFHLKNSSQKSFFGIAFRAKEKYDLLEKNTPIDVVYTLDENIWNGNKSLQLKIIDFSPAGEHPLEITGYEVL